MAGGGRLDLLMCGQDETIAEKLAWVDHFTAQAGPTLDVVSWHTYDFHASDIGLPDHTPLDPTNKTVARLWSTDYLDLALRHVVDALLTGEHDAEAIRADLAAHVKNPEATRVSVEYLRDRVGVPRDMSYPAARQFRAHLNLAVDALQKM